METPNQSNTAFGGIPSTGYIQPLTGNNYNHCHCHCNSCHPLFFYNGLPYGGLNGWSPNTIVPGTTTAPGVANGLGAALNNNSTQTNASNTNVPTGNN